MKTPSANTAIAIDSPHVAPILLVQIAFTSPSALTIYLCSRPFDTRNIFDGNCYDPVILSWSNIRCGAIDPITYTTRAGDMGIDLMNDIPIGGYDRMSSLIYSFDWAYTVVTVMQVHDGALVADDEISLFVGKIENIEGVDQSKISLKISGVELAYNKLWPYTIVNSTDYADADPDDQGKMLPQVWGSCKRVPFRAVDAGWITTLAQDMTSAGTGNTLFTDVTGFPASGTIQIGDEQMTFGSKSNANKTLNISARAQNGTTAVIHDSGEKTAEIQTNYFYIIGHPVKAIDAVYIGDVLADTGDYTAYTGQTGDQDGTYGALACIKFTALPILKKQTNLTHTDTVSDTIDVTNDLDFTATETSVEVNATSTVQAVGTVTNKDHCFDGDGTTYSIIGDGTNSATLRVHFALNDLGTMSKIYFHMYIDTRGNDITLSSDNGTPDVTPINYAGAANIRIGMTPTDSGDWEFYLDIVCGANEDCWLYEISAGIVYEPELTKGGDVTKTGAATGTGTLSGNSVADTVIGGQVSADIDGYQDDGSGTITGTPDALIERPDHIFQHWITEMLGLTTDEIDATDYTASGVFYNADSHVLGVCLTEPPRELEHFRRAAFQSRSLQFWEAGVHHLIYLADGESSDKALSGHRIDLRSLLFSYTMRVNVRNSLIGRYDKFWSGYEDDKIKAERATLKSTSSTSITKYGTLPAEVDLDFINDSTVGQAIIDWMKGLWKEPRLMIGLTVDPSLLPLERGDVITLDTTDTNLLNACVGLVPDPNRYFRILDKMYLPDFRIYLTGIEEKLMDDMEVLSVSPTVNEVQASTGSLVGALTASVTVQAAGTDVSYLTLLDTDKQGDSFYNRVWGDGTYIYVAGGYTGLLAYSVDGAGALTFIDSDFQGASAYTDVYGDGTYIYVACLNQGVRVYSFDGSTLTYVGVKDDGGYYYGVYHDGEYLLCSCGNDGLRSYTRDVAGALTLKIREDNGGSYRGIFGDGNYVYCGRNDYGIGSYSVTPGGSGGLTWEDTDDQGGEYYYLWADGSFIYICDKWGAQGVLTYTVGGGGALTFKTDNEDGGGEPFAASDVWGDGTYIYVACDGASYATKGLSICTVDGNGALTELDRIGNEIADNYGVMGVWGDGTFIYAACYTTGLQSFSVG